MRCFGSYPDEPFHGRKAKCRPCCASNCRNRRVRARHHRGGWRSRMSIVSEIAGNAHEGVRPRINSSANRPLPAMRILSSRSRTACVAELVPPVAMEKPRQSDSPPDRTPPRSKSACDREDRILRTRGRGRPRAQPHRASAAPQREADRAELALRGVIDLGTRVDDDVVSSIAMSTGDQNSAVAQDRGGVRFTLLAHRLHRREPPSRRIIASADRETTNRRRHRPTMRTVPSRSAVAVCPLRPTVIEPAGANRPVRGSNISADLR